MLGRVKNHICYKRKYYLGLMKDQKKLKKLQNVDMHNLSLLSYDINNLYTKEKCAQNDFYGHAYILKKYAGISQSYVIKAAIEHGAYFGADQYWEQDIDHDFPGIIIQGEHRKTILERHTDKEIISIGTLINYAQYSLEEAELNRRKKEQGRTLLVFPMHSTHHTNVNFEKELFIEEIEKKRDKFDMVRVCMYWKDILRGNHIVYEKKGYDIVSAGHMFDRNFLPRLKTIIFLSDLILSNDVGSYVGQAVCIGKPVCLWKQSYETEGKGDEEYKERLHDPCYLNFFEIFSSDKEIISDVQRRACNEVWGTEIKKTPDEIREIFQHLDEEYKHL